MLFFVFLRTHFSALLSKITRLNRNNLRFCLFKINHIAHNFFISLFRMRIGIVLIVVSVETYLLFFCSHKEYTREKESNRIFWSKTDDGYFQAIVRWNILIVRWKCRCKSRKLQSLLYFGSMFVTTQCLIIIFHIIKRHVCWKQ